MLYQAAKSSGHMTGFILYATAVMFVSLLVYIFFLSNKDENWLDHERALQARHGNKG